MRRELLPSNAAMEAGKIVGEVLQRIYADTIYKLHPVKKKVAATTNEKITKDAALQEEIEKLKEYIPNDEKDSDKKQKYLEEIPEVINHALDGLKKLAKKHNLILIEDAAQAIGAKYGKEKIGTIGDFSAFSFQAIKHITTGDGGLLSLKSKKHYAKGKRIRWFGIDREKKLCMIAQNA